MFQKIKQLLFPVNRSEIWLFGLMLTVVCLININFSILRSMRSALVVADAGGSAAFIPYFELFGTFPASILLTWGLSRFMRRLNLSLIFSITTLFFLAFFILFAYAIYPHREAVSHILENKFTFLLNFPQFKIIFTHWPDMIFYIMSELWKVALLSVLFWTFINQSLSLDVAKRFYPPLMLGSSIGAILAGPIVVLSTSTLSWQLLPLSAHHWQHALYLLTFFLTLCGALSFLTFNSLFKILQHRIKPIETDSKEPFSRRLLSLTSSMRYLIRSPYLTALFFIVIAEYIAYALGELVFLEKLKELYPSPSNYCRYMGNLTTWTGVTTAFCALVLTPYLLKTYRWSLSAYIAPVLMLLMTLLFFSAVCLGNASLLPFIVLIGSLHFCIGRSIKYTLFDASKELAFIPLSEEAQVKGKLIIDGIGSRLGRGASSFLSISLFTFIGGPTESALFAGSLAISFALLSLPAIRRMGNEFETMVPQNAPLK